MILYCVNIENLKLNDSKHFEYIEILSIELMQNYLLNLYSRYINRQEFVLVTSIGGYTYVCYIKNKVILVNKVFYDKDLEFYDELLDFYIKINHRGKETIPLFLGEGYYPIRNFIVKYRNLKEEKFYKYLKNFNINYTMGIHYEDIYEFITKKGKKELKWRKDFIQSGIRKEKKINI